MFYLKRFVLFSLLISLVNSTLAYETDVPTRKYNEKTNTDDTVVIKLRNLDPYENLWFSSARVGEHNIGFNINMEESTISLWREIKPTPGIFDFLEYRSFDPLHDEHPHTPSSSRYGMNMYFTADFMWFEVYKDNVPVSFVRNTVFFLGPDQDVVDYYLNNLFTELDISYTNYDDLKEDIQKNYCDIYLFDLKNPAGLGMYDYPKVGQAALLTSVL